MKFRSTYRPRQSFKPRNGFPQPGKPRSTRGISQKRKILSLGGRPAKYGRRVNRLPHWTDPRSYITKGKRHRLFGDDYERLRVAACTRAGGRCECDECAKLPIAMPAHFGKEFLLSSRGDVAHNEHGARKSDELSRVKWKNRVCHINEHNCDGKPIKVTKKSLKTEVLRREALVAQSSTNILDATKEAEVA